MAHLSKPNALQKSDTGISREGLMVKEHEEFSNLSNRCRREFESLADYIWKTPRFLEAETKNEIEKLAEYFPFNGDPRNDARARKLRALRWDLESHSLLRVFPVIMATSNFTSAVSLFEIYLLQLCAEIEAVTEVDFSGVKGVGRTRLFNYMNKAGINYKTIALHEQVDAGFAIRNFLMHASGFLKWSNSADKIKNVILNQTFFENYLRDGGTEKTAERPVRIQNHKFGDQLFIDNEYSFYSCKIFRYYFINLAKECNNTIIVTRSRKS